MATARRVNDMRLAATSGLCRYSPDRRTLRAVAPPPSPFAEERGEEA